MSTPLGGETPGSGEKVTAPVDIGTAIDRTPRDNRLLPTKRPGIVLAFQHYFQNYGSQSRRIQTTAPKERKELIVRTEWMPYVPGVAY